VVCKSQIGQELAYSIKIDKSFTAIEDYKVGSECSVYPNPFDNSLNIRSVEPITQMIVYDLPGAIVKKINSVNNNHIELDLSYLESGTYIIQVQSNSRVYTFKVLKQ
jgi:hypothetical protein